MNIVMSLDEWEALKEKHTVKIGSMGEKMRELEDKVEELNTRIKGSGFDANDLGLERTLLKLNTDIKICYEMRLAETKRREEAEKLAAMKEASSSILSQHYSDATEERCKLAVKLKESEEALEHCKQSLQEELTRRIKLEGELYAATAQAKANCDRVMELENMVNQLKIARVDLRCTDKIVKKKRKHAKR